jgi:alkaline phosphatase
MTTQGETVPDKRNLALYFASLLALIILLLSPGDVFGRQFKNVVVLVADGCGSAHTTLARWYKGAPLALDRMAVGGVRTYSADSLISDSAPAASAFATGHKTTRNFISVLPRSVTIPGMAAVPEGARYKPVATVLEGAKLTGRSVGIAVTVNLQHATPAAFSAHWPDRSDFNEIAEQQVYLNIDVALGGGRRYLLPREKGGARTDGEDLIRALQSRGYAVVQTRKEMTEAKGNKIWGLFADEHLAYEFDRAVLRPGEPSLAEMTARAIEVLSENPKGFFLFVEGSKVDWASHINDPVGVISEVLAFDDAVRLVLDFAENNKETLVLAFSDHGTGGLSIGSRSCDKIDSLLHYGAVVGPLKKARLTADAIETMIGKDRSGENIRRVMAADYGIDDLTQEEIEAIRKGPQGWNGEVGRTISRRSCIDWTTTGHTGEDLFLYHFGYDRPIGIIENTAIASILAGALGFELKEVDERLFVPAHDLFGQVGATTGIDRRDPENPILTVERGNKKAELPFSKDVILLKQTGKEHRMEGVTIYAPKTGKVYLPRQAALLFGIDD